MQTQSHALSGSVSRWASHIALFIELALARRAFDILLGLMLRWGDGFRVAFAALLLE